MGGAMAGSGHFPRIPLTGVWREPNFHQKEKAFYMKFRHVSGRSLALG